MSGYKNSARNHNLLLDFLEERGYLALGSGNSVVTQQTGNCDGTLYMHTEIDGVTDEQYMELKNGFGQHFHQPSCEKRWGGWFLLISHYEPE